MYDPLINILIAAGVVALLGNLLLSAYALHKVRRVHIMSFGIRNEIERIDASGQMFWQLQALDGLYRDLKFASSLPLTRGWAASPDFLSVLARHAMDRRPEVVVECGSGVSTVVLARCMQLNGRGRVIALDHDSVFAEETRRNLARHGLSEWAEIIDAPLQKQFRGGSSRRHRSRARRPSSPRRRARRRGWRSSSDLPTPPLPEATQITFLTSASAPSGKLVAPERLSAGSLSRRRRGRRTRPLRP